MFVQYNLNDCANPDGNQPENEEGVHGNSGVANGLEREPTESLRQIYIHVV